MTKKIYQTPVIWVEQLVVMTIMTGSSATIGNGGNISDFVGDKVAD